jgi:hypothetical protein
MNTLEFENSDFEIHLKFVIFKEFIETLVDLNQSYIIDRFEGITYKLHEIQLDNMDKDFINSISLIIDREYVFDDKYNLDNQNLSAYFKNRFCSRYFALHLILKILYNYSVKINSRSNLDKNIIGIRDHLYESFEIVTDTRKLTNYVLISISNYFKNFEKMEEYDKIILMNAEERYSFIRPLEERINARIEQKMFNEMSNFKQEIRQEMSEFKQEIRQEIQTMKFQMYDKFNTMQNQIDNIQNQMNVMQNQLNCIIELLKSNSK